MQSYPNHSPDPQVRSPVRRSSVNSCGCPYHSTDNLTVYAHLYHRIAPLLITCT